MKEEFLHFIWKFKYFNLVDLKLTNGEPLEVLRSGLAHQHAGPDFFDARLKIGNTKWAGNVEIHVKSSEWYAHKHDRDSVYDRIILHVVWEDDRPVYRKDGTILPTLVLKGRVSRMILEKYQDLKDSIDWIPCVKDISMVDETIKRQQIERMLVDRLQEKSNRIKQLLEINQHDWEDAFYRLLAKYFGLKVNAVPFELLTSSLPFSLLRKYQSSPLQLMALLFGQAGFLSDSFKGSYPRELQKEFAFLKSKHQLKPMDASIWKFMRMRPANFPTIRLAQFARLSLNPPTLFQKLIDCKSLGEIRGLFRVEADSYWQSHYRFDVPAAKNTKKKLGKTATDLLIINAVIPILFSYADWHAQDEFKAQVFDFLQQLPAEKNRIINVWKSLEMPIENAYDSQALLQLKQSFCDQKKCLTCAIGTDLLKLQVHDT